MNTSHQGIWSRALGASVVVSKAAHACGKRSARTTFALGAASVLAFGAGAAKAQDHTYTTAADAGPLSTSPAGVNPFGITLNTGAGISATQSSRISGALGVVFDGPGTLALTSGNTYSGGTRLNSGTLRMNEDSAIGTGLLAIHGGTIGSDTGAVFAGNVAISGDFRIANGGPILGTPPQPPGLTFGGAVVLNTDAHITHTTWGVLAMRGVVSGNRSLMLDATTPFANFVFSGSQSNTYTGLTTVTGNAILGLERTGGAVSVPGDLLVDGHGAVVLSASEQIADNVAVTVNSTGVLSYPGLSFDAPGRVETIGTLNGTGTIGLSGSKLAVGAGDFSGSLGEGTNGTGGQLEKFGSGTLILSGTNSYTGATTITGGTLRAGAANTLSPRSAHTVSSGGTLDLAGHDQRVAGLVNVGTVSLSGAAPGTTLTVTGAYVGQGGLLRMGTALGGSGSASDRLVLDGPTASATGNTRLQVTNFGGLGALTTGNGINVISAQNGATTAAHAFTLAGGHVDAGAYEYRLYDGDAAGAGESWYLRSTTDAVSPGAPAVPGTPTTTRPTYRAEVPMHAALPAILRQGDLAMLSTLHRRVGDESVQIAAAADGSDAPRPDGWGGRNTRAWGRTIAGNTTLSQGGPTLPESRTRIGGFQTGVDLFANGQWNAGLYMGKLRGDTNVKGIYSLNVSTSRAGGLHSDSSYLGGYATWAGKDGRYADFVLQYGLHDISGTTVEQASVGSAAESMTASAEIGQRFALGNGWGIEPQAQLIYNRLNAGDTRIGGSTSVRQDAAGAVIARLGVRLTGDVQTGIGRLQPYARLNLWHGFNGTDRTTFTGGAGSTAFGNGIGYTSVEVAAGATLALTPTTSVYGELGNLIRTGSGQAQVKSSVQGSVGVKLKF